MARYEDSPITEHIGAADGENIEAKRVGNYGYDFANSQWRRINVDASGNSSLGGAAAEGAAPSGNPVEIAVEGRSTLKTNVADGRVTRPVGDRYGRTQTVKPNVTVLSSNGTPITTNTTTSIVSAPSAGNHLKIYRISAQNSSATGTWMYWCDGTTKKHPVYLTQYQSDRQNLEGSWELTTATALQIITSTTGANIEWSVMYETVAD